MTSGRPSAPTSRRSVMTGKQCGKSGGNSNSTGTRPNGPTARSDVQTAPPSLLNPDAASTTAASLRAAAQNNSSSSGMVQAEELVVMIAGPAVLRAVSSGLGTGKSMPKASSRRISQAVTGSAA